MSQKIIFKTYWGRWQLLPGENKTTTTTKLFFEVQIVPSGNVALFKSHKSFDKTAQKRMYMPRKEKEDVRHVK